MNDYDFYVDELVCIYNTCAAAYGDDCASHEVFIEITELINSGKVNSADLCDLLDKFIDQVSL